MIQPQQRHYYYGCFYGGGRRRVRLWLFLTALVTFWLILQSRRPERPEQEQLQLIQAHIQATRAIQLTTTYAQQCPNEVAAAAAAADDNNSSTHSHHDLPTPVILISLGRSGTTSTWQIMSNLTGQETMRGNDYTGVNTAANREFFANHTDETWLMQVLCQRRRDNPQAGVVGIKWKLVPDLLEYAGVRAAFRWIASCSDNNNSNNSNSTSTTTTNQDDTYCPPIKVIRSRRNLLDVIISRYKRDRHRDNTTTSTTATTTNITKLHAHCAPNDTACLHTSLATGLVLPTEHLVNQLQWLTAREDAMDEFLQATLSVGRQQQQQHSSSSSYLSVTYDRLYSDNDTVAVSEWQRLFRYLGQKSDAWVQHLTRTQLLQAVHTAPTHHAWHNQTLGNYAAVRETLQGTPFEHLLH